MKISRQIWLVVFALVALMHLALFLVLDGLLAGSLAPQQKQTPVSVQFLAPPPPLQTLPRPKPLASAERAAPSIRPADEPGQETRAQPQTLAASAGKELPIEESFESSLEPAQGTNGDFSDLSRSGGPALTAYWGDFSSGSPIGQSLINLDFPEPDRYEINMVTEAKGWARLFASAPMHAQASGRIGASGFIPERYAHQGPRRSEVTVFDYENNEIRYESLKEPLPLLKGIQDRLTFMLQLAWLLQKDPERFTLGQTVSLPLAGRNKVEQVDFVVLSDADLALPGGLLVPALHLSSSRENSRYSVQIDIWMDRTDRLLPVRIRFEEARGAVLDLLTVRN